MPTPAEPTINDVLSRLYTIRDTSAASVEQEARALIARQSAKGQLRSGATLKSLASLIESAFDAALVETLAVLRHLRSSAGVDYQACRDQAFLRARDLVPALRGAADLDKWVDAAGSAAASAAIEARIAKLYETISYRFRQFDVGMDPVDMARGPTMTPTATRLQHRLSERQSWFQNEWFFKWHHIAGDDVISIDLFNGRFATYAGLAYWGSPRDIFWDAIARGLRKEVVDQFAWVEEAASGYDKNVAIRAIDECAGLLTGFAQIIRREAVEKDRILRGDGFTFPAGEDQGRWTGANDEDIRGQAEALKAALFPVPIFEPASHSMPEVSKARPSSSPRFQVALSFAGEQRTYVRQVADALAARHIAVFYDEFQANTLWGTDGAEHFHQIYSQDTQYVVMFISAEYVTKAWTRQERRSAISRQMKDDGEYILPVRFDQSEVPGLPDTIQYLLADRFTPAQLAIEIAKKVGVRPTDGKASSLAPPASGATSGEVTFDYSAYNGRYVLGSGSSTFETAWSKGSDTSIYLYNDPDGIHGIALARGATAINEIHDAAVYDYSSRARSLRTGEIAVLRNTDGFYAAVQVVKIEDDARGAESDALTLRYAILTQGGKDFASPGADSSEV
jgi:hypothetical protein